MSLSNMKSWILCSALVSLVVANQVQVGVARIIAVLDPCILYGNSAPGCSVQNKHAPPRQANEYSRGCSSFNIRVSVEERSHLVGMEIDHKPIASSWLGQFLDLQDTLPISGLFKDNLKICNSSLDSRNAVSEEKHQEGMDREEVVRCQNIGEARKQKGYHMV
ncbi:hypothetical protein EZV62_027391 [Acer yangbiense]|uniref:Xylanase inhibitor N-terminal domain-containing protein n=1 Tax=Acer yangbiense TaxID=1000413 RepID=A0A5C7GUH9_9ROSI|nr:hypothetical protein EZV62_027391 [Acer yangbiense]